MPNKPPSQRRGLAPARSIQRTGRKLTTTERGYGWQWQKLRPLVLAEEPLCRFCREKGLIVAAEEIDHIDGDSHNNDRGNLRPLCRACHLERTAKDQAFGKHQWRPDWLRPSTIPLVIVCGPPASGKTSFVEQHADSADLVIDLDVIAASLSGQGTHAWDRSRWLTPAIRARNELLGDIGRPSARWPCAWLIVSEAKAGNRQWWKDHLQPERIVVLETMPDVCMRRVREAADRNIEQACAAITQWWADYQRRTGDEIVRQ